MKLVSIGRRAALAAAMVPRAVVAQDAGSVVGAYWDAITCGRPAEAAALFHPDDLRQLASAALARTAPDDAPTHDAGPVQALDGERLLTALLAFLFPRDPARCGKPGPQVTIEPVEDGAGVRATITFGEEIEVVLLTRLAGRYYLRLGHQDH